MKKRRGSAGAKKSKAGRAKGRGASGRAAGGRAKTGRAKVSVKRPARAPSRKRQRPARTSSGPYVGSSDSGTWSDDFGRAFEGAPVLQGLLEATGSLADVDDVANAFIEARREGVPAPIVIQALWEDEPRFESPGQARRTFSNLFGLYELISSGAKVQLGAAGASQTVVRPKAPPPPSLQGAEPDDSFVEAAWRYLDDHPAEREKFVHAFNNRQDALVSWLDDTGLSDPGFALAIHLACDLYAMMDLGGARVSAVDPDQMPSPHQSRLPEAFVKWIDEAVSEEEQDDEAPLPAHEAARVRQVTSQLVSALWAARPNAVGAA